MSAYDWGYTQFSADWLPYAISSLVIAVVVIVVIGAFASYE